MKPPTRVEVGAFIFDVVIGEGHTNVSNDRGTTDFHKLRITIDGDLNEQHQRKVLLHEVMHAAVFAARDNHSVKFTEEEWVGQSAPMLLLVLRRNPELVAYLTGD